MAFSAPRAAIPVFVGLFAFCTPFSIAAAHTSLAIAVVLLLLDPEARAHAARLRSHPLAIPVAVWCLASIVAVVFAVEPLRSAEKLKKLALLTLLPLGSLPSVRRALRPILSALIISTAIVSVGGLMEHAARGGGLEVRVGGMFGFYMTVAGILMVVALVVFGELLSAAKDPRPRRIVFLIVSQIVILVALIGTYTRGSWIGFAAGAVWLLRRRWIALVTLAVGVGLLLTLGPADVRDRAFSAFDPDHFRNAERILIWKHGLEMVGRDPLTGVGLVIPGELMEREVETENGDIIRVHSHMHNSYLQIAVSMGVPALLAFGWLVVAFFRMGRRAARSEINNLWEEGLAAAYPCVLIALLVNGLFEWNFGDSEILGLFYCLSGLVLGLESDA